MEKNDQIKNLLQGAKHIGLFIEDNPSNDTIGSVLAIFFALKNAGKKPFLTTPNSLEKINTILKKMPKEKIVLSYVGEVSKISYEKTGKQANIYLTPKDNNLSKDNYFCKTISSKEDLLTSDATPFDLLITLGVNSYAKIEEAFENNLDALYQCDIINIDNNLSNQNYGDINIIKDDYCLSQSIASLINELGSDYLNKKVADTLIFGLVNSPKIIRNKNNLEIFLWLLRAKGDFGLILDQDKKELLPKIKILEKTLQNIDQDLFKKHRVYFSSLTLNDFTEASAVFKDLVFVVEKMKNFFQAKSFVLLWEDKKNIQGLFFSDDSLFIDKIITRLKGQYKETGGIFTIQADNLGLAKNIVTELLP
jgi:nanoRNase/pAp phosphatase (c-di-AMP/oligoRNAs hydrolase)